MNWINAPRMWHQVQSTCFAMFLCPPPEPRPTHTLFRIMLVNPPATQPHPKTGQLIHIVEAYIDILNMVVMVLISLKNYKCVAFYDMRIGGWCWSPLTPETRKTVGQVVSRRRRQSPGWWCSTHVQYRRGVVLGVGMKFSNWDKVRV